MTKLLRINVSTEERFDLLDACQDSCVHCQSKIGFYTAQIVQSRTTNGEFSPITKKFCLCSSCSDQLVPPADYWTQVTNRLRAALFNQNQWV